MMGNIYLYLYLCDELKYKELEEFGERNIKILKYI